MVIDEECVDEHENSLWDPKGVVQFTFSLGFKILDAIVGDITNSTPGECWDFRDFDVLVESKFLLEYHHRISVNLFPRSRLDYFERI
jgi:hypothetical protein